MSIYIELHKKAVTTLNKYSLGAMLEKLDVDKIHEMIRKHKERLIAIKSYEEGLLLANEVITKMGFPILIQMFVKDDADRRALYAVFVEWRDSILTPDV